MKVRAAAEGDLEALITLNAEVQRRHIEQYPQYFKPLTDPTAVKEFFQKTLADPTNTIIIAETDKCALGYIWLEHQEKPETSLKMAVRRLYVHHLVIASSARRKGVATALMHHVEEHAASQGIPEILLDTWAANQEALDFFATCGFEPLRIVQKKTIATKS
jgi:diamine N-acetyltransferase